MRIPLCVSAAGALSLLCAAAQPETVWRLDLTRPEVVAQLQGAELLPDGGPGGQPAIRLRGPAQPTLRLRTESFRDAVVSIRAKVKGHRQSQAFGECLHLRAAYPIRHREDWLYRPPAVRPLEAPDWQDYAITCHIPAYAGDFLLVFGHAGQDGDVLYSDVRLDRLPDPPPAPPNSPSKPPSGQPIVAPPSARSPRRRTFVPSPRTGAATSSAGSSPVVRRPSPRNATAPGYRRTSTGSTPSSPSAAATASGSSSTSTAAQER